MSTSTKSRTAEETLARRSREGDDLSGGRPVAKALEGEGVDTVFSVCGGHIVDIYGGCVGEGIRRGRGRDRHRRNPARRAHGPRQARAVWLEEGRDAAEIAPARRCARASVESTGKSAVIDTWVDPNEYAPGTRNQTMYEQKSRVKQ